MRNNHKKCLVLNGDFTPLAIIDWKKAITWLVKSSNDIQIIDFYKNDYIKGAEDKIYPLPAVIKTKNYHNFANKPVNFSRKNVFIRDNFCCQYCGSHISEVQLTYDHVIPKSLWDYTKGTPTNWNNIVTACVRCNNKKSNKTLDQARFSLKTVPYEPKKQKKYLPITMLLARINNAALAPREWMIYIK